MTLAAALVIPPMDPFGLPAAPVLFVVLIVATMLTHLVFMNFVLGGSIIATILDCMTLLRRGDHNETVRVMWQVMPVAMSFTITTGIAPLLFVQVLYGHFFYTANVLMGYTWLMLIPALLIVFYLIYFLTHKLGNAMRNRAGKWDMRPGRRLSVSLLVAAIAMSVAWILTNDHMLSLQPRDWPAGGQWQQTRLIVSPATTIPRYLHMVGGAIAVSGLWICLLGWWRGRRAIASLESATAMTRTGLRVIAATVVATAVLGLVFLLSLPADISTSLWSLSPLSLLWLLALVGVVVQFGLIRLALREPHRFKWLGGLMASMLLTVLGMLCGREQVRLAFLSRGDVGFRLNDWAVHPQWSSLVLFGVTLALTLGASAWLIFVSARARQENQPRDIYEESSESGDNSSGA